MERRRCAFCWKPFKKKNRLHLFCSRSCHKREEYARIGRKNTSPSSSLTFQRRFFYKYPEIPPICESCRETRIVELAHKVPCFGRRTAANTTPETVWVLCPTCHRLLDRGILSAKDLGLE